MKLIAGFQALLALCVLGHIPICLAQSNDTNDNTPFLDDKEPVLRSMSCGREGDCDIVEGSYCNLDTNLCTCKPDYPVTDTRHCYKESKFEEFCRLDIQCQSLDKNSRCNLDLNVCNCQPRYQPQSYSRGRKYCVEDLSGTNMSPGSYYDPALFGIMGGLVLMFIVLCVVLQLFAKAQFRENRTIFNTPNPRLMNVSLMKDNPKHDRKVSNAEEGFSREMIQRRKNSPAVSTPGPSTKGQSEEEQGFTEIQE